MKMVAFERHIIFPARGIQGTTELSLQFDGHGLTLRSTDARGSYVNCGTALGTSIMPRDGLVVGTHASCSDDIEAMSCGPSTDYGSCGHNLRGHVGEVGGVGSRLYAEPGLLKRFARGRRVAEEILIFLIEVVLRIRVREVIIAEIRELHANIYECQWSGNFCLAGSSFG